MKAPNTCTAILNVMYSRIDRLKNINMAIETGTYLGNGAIDLSKMFDMVWTVELYPDNNPYDNNLSLRKIHENINKEYKNINFIYGNSIEGLQNILKENCDITFFIHLDAHTFNYSPMLHELEAIEKYSNKKDHIILIDDCKFLGTNGYPTYTEMKNSILKINSEYNIFNTGLGNDYILVF